MSKAITVTEFKAQCLSLLDDVIENREVITITRRGKPVAMLRAMCPKLGACGKV
ncbi:MAG: type II toxin-antitoxin system Phd/YefM family antitoxin [Bryobacteraceae bacterium]|nr:type II toxin-antitoxin system Phd/YefM family antitoxin [Bryobacteraceae bacterium]